MVLNLQGWAETLQGLLIMGCCHSRTSQQRAPAAREDPRIHVVVVVAGNWLGTFHRPGKLSVSDKAQSLIQRQF